MVFGKSYGAKKFVVSRFLKKQEHFLYLRRYQVELDKVFQKDKSGKDFFSDIRKEFPNHELTTKGHKFYCNGEIFGYAYRYTEAQDLKSSAGFENIKTIILDEYPIEKSRFRSYLPDEGMLLLGLFDSILRNRSDVRIFILGNATEGIEYCPLFTFFDLTLPYNSDIKLFKDNTILVQYMNNTDFRKDREETLIGKLAKGTKYETYAIHNKPLDKNNDFIAKKTGSSKFQFAIIYKDEVYRYLE